ncbi:MAG: hypothetical protein IIZ34_02510, partial [Eubacterium sp.]|nr:hypothetical protein [Eubacterium sp.]
MTGRETITVRSGAARKLLMILLSVVITATFSPALSFGADSGSQLASKANRLVTDKARPIRGIVISGKVIRHTGDGFEHLRQEAQEVLDDAMESVGKQEHYNAQVWAEINKSYRQAQELIRKARKYSDLIGYSVWGFVVLSEEIGKQITRLESLAPLNKTVFDGKGDYASLQKKMRGELAENRKIFVRSDFNDYYWDVIQDYFDETGDLISAMTDQKVARRLTAAGTSVTAYTLDAYILADARIQEFEDLEVMEELAEEEESDEDEELE